MKEKEKNNKQSLVAKHALNRLNKVEQDRREAYSKKDSSLSWQTIVVVIVFAIIVIIMLFSMKF